MTIFILTAGGLSSLAAGCRGTKSLGRLHCFITAALIGWQELRNVMRPSELTAKL